MIYYCSQFKATVKPNSVQCSSLFLDVYLHVQVAVFSYRIVCVRYLFFLFKKKNTHHTLCFYCIVTFPITTITWFFFLQEHSTHPTLLLT